MPDAYTKQEHFYYYDLLNDYINIDFFAIRAATGGSGGLYASSNFPILYHQFKNKVRNISYQTINISKTTCLPEESVSQYSIYNNIWKNEYLFPYNRTDNKDVHRPAATAPRAGDGTSSPNTLIEDLLFNRVLLSYSAVQLDTVRIDTAYSRLRNPYSVNGINNSSNEVLRFKSVKTTDPSVRDRDYVVEYPHDTLLVKYIDERENNGLVKLEHNAAGLYTRYRYAKGTKVRVVDITPPYRNYNYDEIFNYAEPIKVITGFGLSDSLWVDYKYNVDNSINTITTTNGAKTSFEYDEFSRLHKSYLNGLLLNINKYSNFNNNQNLSFEARAEQNFVETFILLDTAQQFKNIAEHSMSIIDPLGRNYDILSQISYNYSSSNPNQVLSTLTLHKGLSIFDNWDRVVKQYKPFVEISANPQMKPAFNNLNSPYTEAIYENNTRSKVIKAAKYGENISTGHTVGSGYRIIDGNQLTAEIMTGDDPTLFKVICDPNLASSMKFLKAVIQDEDGKKHISYVNANGQEIATKSYVSSGNAVLTQKIYDSRANLITTINPSFQSTFMKYNLLGQLYQKRSVDNGTEYYMYNSTGQVVLLQDSNGRAGIEDNAKPFLRLFTYDKYGRPVTQEKWVIKTGSNPLSYMVLINVPNGIKAPFTYATTNDRHFNWYTTTTVNGVQVKTAVSPYTLLTSPNTEKKWFYGEAKPGIVTGVFAPEIVNYMNVAANKATNVKGNLSVTYSYNLGKLTEIRIFSYDNADRPKYEVIQYSAGTVKIPSIIKYPEYNLRGSVKTQVIDYGLNGDDLKYEYGYDGWNRLLSVKLNGKLTARFEHDDALGLIKQVEYFDQCANGKTLSIDTLRYTYDIRDRLTQIKSLLYTEKLCYDYDVPQPNAWDATLVSSTINFNGNINGTTHIINTNRASNAAILNGMMDKPTYYGYTYDGINRLTKADASVMNVLKAALNTSVLIPENNYGDESLVYDNVGNIRSLKRGMYYSPNSSNPANWVQNWNYNYVSGTNRLSSVDSNGVVLRNYGYDGNGNIRNDSYRKLNSLRLNRGNLNSRVSIGSGASLKGFDYDYDINDNRVYKKNMVSNSNEEYYLTDFSGKVHGVYTLADKQWKWYVYALNRMQEISNSGKKYIVSDHLGSTRVTYTANISTCNLNSTVYTITGAYDYYAFGKILRSYTGNSKDKFKFGGKEKDEETNLDYFGARNLDDDINRWTAVDPLKDARLAWNPYNYCRNNPINNVDPNGMVDGWVQDKETQEYTWDKNVNSQEDFDKSGYDKDKFSYAGQEFQVASSLGSTAGLYTLYYGSDGTIKTYDYPMWVEAGKSHIGLKEGNNAEIQSMIDKHNEDFPSENGAKAINNDKDPWCGVFVYSCLKESGTMVSQKPNTWQKPALNSFYNTNWKEGVKVDNPVFGAIAVMKYGHVGIVVGYNDKQIFLLGGNQPQNNSPIRDGVEVNIRELNRSLVKDYVIPQNYLAPPLPNFH